MISRLGRSVGGRPLTKALSMPMIIWFASLSGFRFFGDLTLNVFLELIDPSAEEFRGVTSKGRIMQKASGSGGASLCPGAAPI